MPSGEEQPHVVGMDIGSSGVRAAALDEEGRTCAVATWNYEDQRNRDEPTAWWRGVEICLRQLSRKVRLQQVAAVAVDGTSGTVLALDEAHAPLGKALMYDAPCTNLEILSQLDISVPEDSPARGTQSALARAAFLTRQRGTVHVVHQADWIALQLGSGEPVSDENNALKSGYDLATSCWPDWVSALVDPAMLPKVVPAGTVLGRVGPRAVELGLPSAAVLVSGTTDGCASFLATGAGEVGDGVTALGSTLVLKLLSNREIKAPESGIYSHRIAGMWLAGGASNSGGAVIRSFFADERLAELTARVDPDRPTGLDYYPLLRPGERFPVSDPGLQPRLQPRPADDAVFFQAMLEGMATIEARGYARLSELGAPTLRSVRSVGGGAANERWARIRQRKLGVPFLAAQSTEAAAGTARLALKALSP